MASIIKHKSGWRAQVAIRGIRRSKVFERKQDAKDWAAREEYLIKAGEGEYGPGNLGDVFDRYARTVSPTKRGERWEQVRLRLFSRDRIAKIPVKELKASDFADWRDRRLEQVATSTVRREMVLLSNVMKVAVEEWGLLPVSPLKSVKKPKGRPPRDRLVTDAEIDRMRAAARSRMEQEAIRAFCFSCATGMRAGEVLSATVEGRVADIPHTKNGEARKVPLSSRAVELWGNGFTLSSRQLDTAFRRVRDRAGVEGLTYHDSRHRCVTDLSKILDPLALAKVVGHTDLDQLRTYYSETVESLARRLG